MQILQGMIMVERVPSWGGNDILRAWEEESFLYILGHLYGEIRGEHRERNSMRKAEIWRDSGDLGDSIGRRTFVSVCLDR